jgi:hypothetical protein
LTSEAVSEVETLIRDFDAMSRRHDDALRDLGVDPEQFTEDGRRARRALGLGPEEREILRAGPQQADTRGGSVCGRPLAIGAPA